MKDRSETVAELSGNTLRIYMVNTKCIAKPQGKNIWQTSGHMKADVISDYADQFSLWLLHMCTGKNLALHVPKESDHQIYCNCDITKVMY